MKNTMALLALLVALPAASVAQAPGAKTSLDQIKSNVANTSGAEKERWSSNIQLWDVKLAQKDKLSPADVGKMKASLDAIKANVAKITEPAEKGRWEANDQLWQAVIEDAAQAPSASMVMMKMKGSLDEMKANVARITGARERQRWEANRDLWVGVVGNKSCCSHSSMP